MTTHSLTNHYAPINAPALTDRCYGITRTQIVFLLCVSRVYKSYSVWDLFICEETHASTQTHKTQPFTAVADEWMEWSHASAAARTYPRQHHRRGAAVLSPPHTWPAIQPPFGYSWLSPAATWLHSRQGRVPKVTTPWRRSLVKFLLIISIKNYKDHLLSLMKS